MKRIETSAKSTVAVDLPRLSRCLVCVGNALFAAFLLISVPQVAHGDELHEMFNVHEKHGVKRVDHSAWDKLLKTYLNTGKDGLNRVDYTRLKKSGVSTLRRYLQDLERLDPSTLTIAEQFAFWANLYNAKTVEIVATHYPVTSIKDIKLGLNPFAGPWKAKVVTVNGRALSLDDIEHRIMRPVWKDPRVHYAVNCASVGCPNLASRAYTGKRLEKMLNEAARAYVNSPRGVQMDGSRLVVSSLYDWYGSDFGRSGPEILAHIVKYAKEPLARRLKQAGGIDGYVYDWMLNDAK